MQNKVSLHSGMDLTVSSALGILGETRCLIVLDRNLYPDNDSRSKRNKEFIIPMEVEEMEELMKVLKFHIKNGEK